VLVLTYITYWSFRLVLVLTYITYWSFRLVLVLTYITYLLLLFQQCTVNIKMQNTF
jgi:hypothetical protein